MFQNKVELYFVEKDISRHIMFFFSHIDKKCRGLSNVFVICLGQNTTENKKILVHFSAVSLHLCSKQVVLGGAFSHSTSYRSSAQCSLFKINGHALSDHVNFDPLHLLTLAALYYSMRKPISPILRAHTGTHNKPSSV